MADSNKLYCQAYRDSRGEWRWRIRRSGNHQILSDSGEGYRDRHDMLETLFKLHPGIDVEYLEDDDA